MRVQHSRGIVVGQMNKPRPTREASSAAVVADWEASTGDVRCIPVPGDTWRITRKLCATHATRHAAPWATYWNGELVGSRVLDLLTPLGILRRRLEVRLGFVDDVVVEIVDD